MAAAVDVLRSEVELQGREQELIVARNSLAKQKLVLARVIGLPAGQAFDLTTEVAYQSLATMSLDEGLEFAYAHRPDYQSAIAQLSPPNFRGKPLLPSATRRFQSKPTTAISA